MMSSSSPVLNAEQHAAQRAWQYWFSDGLTNLAVGAGILLMSFCLLYAPQWPPKPVPLVVWAFALFCYLSSIVRHRQIVEWFKMRTTYPRTGYVHAPADNPACELSAISFGQPVAQSEAARVRSERRTTTYLMLGLVVIAAVFEIVAIHQWWVWLAASLIVSAAMVVARRQFRVSWIVPLGFPILGLLMTRFPSPLHQAPAYFLVGWGVLFLLDGAFTLIRYLLQNPAPKATAA
jgi:hypothetical protein